MDASSKDLHKIIVFGDEFSCKTNLLNLLASKQVFEETFYDEQADFKSQAVTIDNKHFVLIDTINFGSCVKTSSLKKKINLFLNTSSEFNLVLIALSLSHHPNNIETIELLLKTFQFSKTERIYFILTQGDFLNKKDERDEKYLIIEEDLRSSLNRNDIKIDKINVLYFDEDNKREMKNRIITKASEDQKYCDITAKLDVNNIVNLFVKASNEEDVSENKDSLWTLFLKYVNSNPMLNNSNIML